VQLRHSPPKPQYFFSFFFLLLVFGGLDFSTHTFFFPLADFPSGAEDAPQNNGCSLFPSPTSPPLHSPNPSPPFPPLHPLAPGYVCVASSRLSLLVSFLLGRRFFKDKLRFFLHTPPRVGLVHRQPARWEHVLFASFLPPGSIHGTRKSNFKTAGPRVFGCFAFDDAFHDNTKVVLERAMAYVFFFSELNQLFFPPSVTTS